MNTITFIPLIFSLTTTYFANNPKKENLFDKIDAINEVFEKCGFPTNKGVPVEYICDIYNVKSKENNIYIDFEGQNGFFLLNQSYELISYNFEVDIPLIRGNNKSVVYYYGDFYEDINGNYNLLPKQYISQNYNYFLSSPTYTSSLVNYNNISSYLHNKYGPTFSLSSSIKLSGLSSTVNSDGYTQYDESVFLTNPGGGSEGNCGLVSSCNALAYYSRYGGYSYFPSYSSTTTVDPYSNTSLLLSAGSMGYSPKSSLVTLHSIYNTFRNYAITKGYIVSGMNESDTGYCYEHTASYYGYSASYVPHSMSTTTQLLIDNELSNNRPLQLRTGGDCIYQSHGMMVTGSRLYTATIYEYGMYIPVEIYCLSVYDGWSNSERWYDFEQISVFPYFPNGYRSQDTSVAEYHIS